MPELIGDLLHRRPDLSRFLDGLGMTRQGVLKAIKGKVLPATRVGGTWVLSGP